MHESEIFIGKQFSRWEIISGPEKLYPGSGLCKWLCRCECGSEKHITDINLLSGATTGCRKCREWDRPKSDSLIGAKIQSATVVEYVGNRKGKPMYQCRCECGRLNIQASHYLLNGKPPLCECKKKDRGGKTVQNVIYRRICYQAKRRELIVSVTRDECFALLSWQSYRCALSGLPLAVAGNVGDHYHGATTASLDRMDSSAGYTAENIQWVHKDVNKMKMDLCQDRFIEICQAVARHADAEMHGGRIDRDGDRAA